MFVDLSQVGQLRPLESGNDMARLEAEIAARNTAQPNSSENANA